MARSMTSASRDGTSGRAARSLTRDSGAVSRTNVGDGASFDRVPAAEDVKEKNAETVDIALDARRFPVEHFRRNVQRRAGQIRDRAVAEAPVRFRSPSARPGRRRRP